MNNIHPQIFKKRRVELMNRIKQTSPELNNFAVIIFAAYEIERHFFRQESSFYYLTGVTEPGAVAVLSTDGTEVLYLPNFGTTREAWVNVNFFTNERDGGESAGRIGMSRIKDLGNQIRGYSLGSYFDATHYRNLINDLKGRLPALDQVFTLIDAKSSWYDVPATRFDFFAEHVSGLYEKTTDCAPQVHEMRKTKDEHEIALIQKAVDITCDAQRRVAQCVAPGKIEYEIRAELEKVFTEQGAVRFGFPSIVATGKNTTVLHYTNLDHTLQDGELVVVDVGAEYGYYAADITRTFPVSGKFTPRQKEIYNAVLETQEYIAAMAKPGMYARSNDKEPDKALHNLSVNFLKERGLDQYFIHGIGHYMGLDVHDVGSYAQELKPGDVITIEPGIYIREEGLGVRIEDDYLITENGCKKLSGGLGSTVEEVEQMMER